MPVAVMAAPLAIVDRDATLARLLPVVGAWCRRLGGPGVDAEEACADVLMVVARKWETLSDLDHLDPWVFAVTRRVVSRHRRRVWWRRWLPGGVPDQADAAPLAPSRRFAADRALRVSRVLEQLPEAQREVLVLSAIEERSDTEVAALLGIPAGTVKSRLRLARERFRAIVASNPDLYDLSEVHDG